MDNVDNKYNMNAGEVTLDLNKLLEVAATAIHYSEAEMERLHSRIRDDLFRSIHMYDPQDKYHATCNANSDTEYLERAVKAYCEGVKAYFYLSESIRRETVKAAK